MHVGDTAAEKEFDVAIQMTLMKEIQDNKNGQTKVTFIKEI